MSNTGVTPVEHPREAGVNTIEVERVAAGLQMTIYAPEVHAWMKDFCEAKTVVNPKTGWPREGHFLSVKTDTATNNLLGTLPPCLAQYNSSGLRTGENGADINLSVLRHEKAETGPVRIVWSGLYDADTAADILKKATQTLVDLYRTHMRSYKGTATIKITR